MAHVQKTHLTPRATPPPPTRKTRAFTQHTNTRKGVCAEREVTRFRKCDLWWWASRGPLDLHSVRSGGGGGGGRRCRRSLSLMTSIPPPPGPDHGKMFIKKILLQNQLWRAIRPADMLPKCYFIFIYYF